MRDLSFHESIEFAWPDITVYERPVGLRLSAIVQPFSIIDGPEVWDIRYGGYEQTNREWTFPENCIYRYSLSQQEYFIIFPYTIQNIDGIIVHDMWIL
jgi:hypothetical protein